MLYVADRFLFYDSGRALVTFCSLIDFRLYLFRCLMIGTRCNLMLSKTSQTAHGYEIKNAEEVEQILLQQSVVG